MAVRLINSTLSHRLVGFYTAKKNNFTDPGCDDYTYLANLNEMVNGNIEYEPEPIGQEEWGSLPDGGYGDCDDYATTKRAALIKAGWSLDRIHLATCIMENGYSNVVLIAAVLIGPYPRNARAAVRPG
nr:transglutaminase-like cysteine peptidase [uncultured Pseudodesulfovibrio sp.]